MTIDSAGGPVLAIAHRSDAPQALMKLMLNNSINYLAIASIVESPGLFSPYASKERIPHMNSTGSAVSASGVAQTSNQMARPKVLNQVRIVLRGRHYSQRTESAYLNWIKHFILFHNKRHPADSGGQQSCSSLF